MLADGPRTGSYRVGWVGVNTSARIVRGDVADFMLRQVGETPYLRQAPMISAWRRYARVDEPGRGNIPARLIPICATVLP